MIGEGTYIFYREEELRRRKYWEKNEIFLQRRRKMEKNMEGNI